MADIPIQRKEGRNIWPLLLGLLLLLLILWYVFARRHGDTTTATRTDSTTTTTTNAGTVSDSTAGAGAAAAGGAAAMAGGTSTVNNGSSPVPSSAKQMTDAEIFSMIRAVNQGEVDAGHLAEQKASSADVKAFAREMVTDHTQMTQQSASLASALGAIPKPDAQDSIISGNQALAQKLQSTPGGPAFDRAYIDGQVTGHQRALSFLQHAQGQAQNAQLKQMIGGAVPKVQQHLDRARQLQGQLPSA